MVVALLPASAAAFAPRSAPTIVLTTVEPWLTQTLRRIRRIKRPSNNVAQHTRVLADVLSGPDALWLLCSIMLPKAPDAQLVKDPNPLVEAFNYQILHVSAYVVHVDMVAENEVAFKLTPESISSLVRYHRHIYLVDMAASTWDWPDKRAQIERLHTDFIQAVNRYVFRADKHALEGMEERGAGELLEGRSQEAKNGIMGMFQPLLPPPPSEMLNIMVQTPVNMSAGAGQSGWFPTVPSQVSAGPTIGSVATLPSQSSPATSSQQHGSTMALSGFSDLPDLDLDLGLDLDLDLDLDLLAMCQAECMLGSTAVDLSSPAFTDGNGQLFSATMSPISVGQMSTMVSPTQLAFSITDPAMMFNPCGQGMVPTPGIDLSALSSGSWAYANGLQPQYGTAT